jgi:hypothetical protein
VARAAVSVARGAGRQRVLRAVHRRIRHELRPAAAAAHARRVRLRAARRAAGVPMERNGTESPGWFRRIVGTLLLLSLHSLSRAHSAVSETLCDAPTTLAPRPSAWVRLRARWVTLSSLGDAMGSGRHLLPCGVPSAAHPALVTLTPTLTPGAAAVLAWRAAVHGGVSRHALPARRALLLGLLGRARVRPPPLGVPHRRAGAVPRGRRAAVPGVPRHAAARAQAGRRRLRRRTCAGGLGTTSFALRTLNASEPTPGGNYNASA